MKNILLIGSEGSMGRRYQAILNFLGIKFMRSDITLLCDGSISGIPGILNEKALSLFDGFIIATPTAKHLDGIGSLVGSGKPILCEKPITKHWEGHFHGLWGDADVEMMIQYYFLNPSVNFLKSYSGNNFSSYDYFRTGNDGLAWDCIQIIALHEGPNDNLKLDNKSPIWKCTINNKELNIADMDAAYVRAVQSWVSGRRHSKDLIQNAHYKVIDYLNYLEEIPD